jgi:hypothetical protein
VSRVIEAAGIESKGAVMNEGSPYLTSPFWFLGGTAPKRHGGELGLERTEAGP